MNGKLCRIPKFHTITRRICISTQQSMLDKCFFTNKMLILMLITCNKMNSHLTFPSDWWVEEYHTDWTKWNIPNGSLWFSLATKFSFKVFQFWFFLMSGHNSIYVTFSLYQMDIKRFTKYLCGQQRKTGWDRWVALFQKSVRSFSICRKRENRKIYCSCAFFRRRHESWQIRAIYLLCRAKNKINYIFWWFYFIVYIFQLLSLFIDLDTIFFSGAMKNIKSHRRDHGQFAFRKSMISFCLCFCYKNDSFIRFHIGPQKRKFNGNRLVKKNCLTKR